MQFMFPQNIVPFSPCNKKTKLTFSAKDIAIIRTFIYIVTALDVFAPLLKIEIPTLNK